MFASPPLLAFGFGNLAMLGWLAAAAAPLLIHLWNRHRYRETSWAAMQFLLAAMRRNSRRLQVQQWLLMAVRMLIIVLVVSAVAEPYGERIMAGGSAEPVHRVIVLDASYSMAYQNGSETAFSQAKKMAAQLVRNSRPGDSFSVIRMGLKTEEIAGVGVVDREAVAARIEGVDISQSRADLGGTLSSIQRILASDSSDRRLPTRKEVLFFTDLQRATWEPVAVDSTTNRQLSNTLQQISQRATITLIDVGPKETANLAVTSLTSPEPFATPHRDATFNVTLHQFGATPRLKCSVELLIDQTAVAEEATDVPANGEATLRFQHRFSATGDHDVAVRASADQLDIDNSRWLVTIVRPNVQVLCVEGRPNAAKFVASALNPGASTDSPIQPTVIDEGAFADVRLDEYECVFLCNVGQITANEAARMRRFVQAGGGLVLFLGDQVDAANYNSWSTASAATEISGRGVPEHAAPKTAVDRGTESGTTTNESQQTGFIPATLGDITPNTQPGIDPLDYRHPIVAPFRGRERAGLLTTPIATYVRLLLPTAHLGTEVAAATRSGDPLIVTSSIGQGRVVLVATDASLSSTDQRTGERWTNWPTWPSFLPVVRELLSFAAGNRGDFRQTIVGTTLSGEVPEAALAGALRLRRPDGQKAAVSLSENAIDRTWNYSDTNVSGIYSLEGLPNRNESFAVNVETAESDLTKLDARKLPPHVHVQTAWAEDSRAIDAAVLSQSSWTEPLLWAAFVLLLVEAFLAWRFGRGVV